jgi:hypothetical protein
MIAQDRYLSATTAALLALAAIAALAPHGAKASALSYSYLNVDDFGIGITPSPGATISISNLANVSNLAAHLNGGNASDGGSTETLPLNIALQCVGNCSGIGENDWVQHAGNLDMSRGDSLIGAPTDPTAPSGADATAHSQQVSETNLFGPGSGSATTRNGLVAGFSFVIDGGTGDGGVFDLSFVADQHMFAQLTSTPGHVEASTAFRVTIRNSDGDAVFDWAPDGSPNPGDISGLIGGTVISDDCNLNTNIARTTDNGPSQVNLTGCVFHIVSNPFPANEQFDFALNSDADTFASLAATAVIEPMFPGIFGFASLLTGLYLKRRNRA